MARSQANVSVTLSILDRLIDKEPKNQVEAPLTHSQSVRALKSAVLRDLEWLVNTRRVFDLPNESLKEVNRSVCVYGLPDFSGYSMASSTEQGKLIRQLLTAIKLFEPRLVNARIIPGEVSEAGIQEFRFRIEGLLQMDPAPQPVAFDSVLELRSGVCRLSGTANA